MDKQLDGCVGVLEGFDVDEVVVDECIGELACDQKELRIFFCFSFFFLFF